MESLCFILFCGEFEEFFVGLNRVSDKLSLAEQRVSRNRRGNVPGGFFVGYMNRSERNSVFFRNFAHSRNPVACERALICVIQNESALVCFRVLRARLKFRWLCIFAKGQIHKSYSAIRNVGGFKTFVSKEFRVGKEFSFFPLGAKNTNTFFVLCFGVADTFRQKVVGVAVTLHRTGNPQTVYIEISVRIDRNPRVFRGNIFDKTFSSFFADARQE